LNAGTRVRKARLQRGLTQSELAGDDYSAAYVSIIESGKREPSERVLKAFAKTLGMTYEELASGRPPHAEATLEEELLAIRQALSSGDLSEATGNCRRVARRAAAYGLTRVHDKAAVLEAFSLELGGDFSGALALYERLQETIRDEHLAIKADAVAGRARCLRMLGDTPYSTYVAESYLSHIRRSGLTDPDSLIRIYMTLVASYFEGGMVQQASAVADEALKLSAKARDAERVAGMHINVARVLMEQGNYREAAESFSTAEKLYGELAYAAELGVTFLARAFLMNKQEQYAEARSDLDSALRIFEATGNEVNQARAMSELGATQRIEGSPEEAIFTLQRAVRLADKRAPATAAISHRELALCHAGLGDGTKMRSHFKKAIDLLEGSGESYELAVTYRALGDALREEKDYQEACDAYRSAAVALEAA
jgi:tetratricopeptide (TPR) repeat protein